MKRIEYRTLDKSGWGEGPWLNEPDKIQWKDEATGLPCLIVRNPHMGFLCGYVGVPQGHPAHGKGYDDVQAFAVHGGLTFSDGCSHGEDESSGICHRPGEGEPDDVWWLGFDTGHFRDLAPGTSMPYRDKTDPSNTYRDVAYVAQQCRDLARQLKALT